MTTDDAPADRDTAKGLTNVLRERRSRRFGVGMEMPAGPMAYRSSQPPLPLTEDEEALLAFAACGITGAALGDLIYTPGGGGTIMAGLAGRTVSSGDALQTVSVFVTNDEATYLLKRPRDFDPKEVPELVEHARAEQFTELYRRSRVQIKDGRAAPPLDPPFNLDVNRWSLYAPAGTYFLPVNDLTAMYINGLLEILSEHNGFLVVDDRRWYRPAGLSAYRRSKGGHLYDDPADQRQISVQQLETLVTEFVSIEQGMVLQNLSLMAQAMGLGGFAHWAAHPFGWLEALGFRMRQIPATRYFGMGPILTLFARLLKRDVPVGYAEGLQRSGESLLTPHCPPFFATMEEAVHAVVERKFGPSGIFRGGVSQGAFREPAEIAAAAREPSAAAIEATIAYCEYIYERYGRFPAYQPPFRTVLGFQATHVDVDFYDRFYKPEALSDAQRRHMERWHG